MYVYNIYIYLPRIVQKLENAYPVSGIIKNTIYYYAVYCVYMFPGDNGAAQTGYGGSDRYFKCNVTLKFAHFH